MVKKERRVQQQQQLKKWGSMKMNFLFVLHHWRVKPSNHSSEFLYFFSLYELKKFRFLFPCNQINELLRMHWWRRRRHIFFFSVVFGTLHLVSLCACTNRWYFHSDYDLMEDYAHRASYDVHFHVFKWIHISLNCEFVIILYIERNKRLPTNMFHKCMQIISTISFLPFRVLRGVRR